tara:strand:- start:201 stop:929 length:729 start_codon:yes stop_codon:yes gene_type:complete
MAKIVYTQPELTFISSLVVGECGAVNVKRIVDNKETNDKWFSIELAEKLSTSTAGGFNALAFMNPRDTRFTQSGGLPRRQWLNGSADMIMKVLPSITQAQLDSLQIGIGRVNALVKHPEAGSANRRFKLQIVGILESNMTPDAWELKPENYNRAKKTAGGGPDARDIKGVNEQTGAIEQIFEKVVVQTAVLNTEGVWVNALDAKTQLPWEHQMIAEYKLEEETTVAYNTQQVAEAVLTPNLD